MKGLLEDEVRGEVVSTDQNRSVASIRVTATGSAIRDFSDLQLNDVIETVTTLFQLYKGEII